MCFLLMPILEAAEVFLLEVSKKFSLRQTRDWKAHPEQLKIGNVMWAKTRSYTGKW